MTYKLPEGWQEVRLGDIVEVNPKESLKRGKIFRKVAMADVLEHVRRINSYSFEEYKGGSRFKNGDTLFSRITPCLENGKIAFVDILEKDEIAFGSTEFLILRNINGVSDEKYIYYLSLNPKVRDKSIKSMVGSSGRQRVQTDVFKEITISLPPLEEQKTIASTLSALDDKIELNNKINENLEAQAQALFKHWFVNFEFPDENGNPYKSSGGAMIESELGMIPGGWEVVELSDIGDLTMGLSPKSSSYNLENIGLPLLNGAADFKNGMINATKYTIEPTRVGKIGDLVFCIRATIGNLTFADREYCIGRGVAAITPKNAIYIGLIYYNLLKSMERLISEASGSVILGLSKSDINDMKLVLPNVKVLEEFSNIINLIFNKKDIIKQQNQKFSQFRDFLLPKLMSGKIRIPLES